MHISDLPYEVLSSILKEAATSNAREGVSFTYGLGEAPIPPQKSQLSRYIRGPVNPDALRWDTTSAIRRVSRLWHQWALQYALDTVNIRRWRGAERWAELSNKSKLYDIYELIEKPSGFAVYRDPFVSLRDTVKLFSKHPSVTAHIRRLWFNGFFNAETDGLIFQVIRSCHRLSSLSVPWTLLRHGTPNDWAHLLGIASPGDLPVRSLEFHAVCLTEAASTNRENLIDMQPLSSPQVDFGQLRRLKFIGNTTFMPASDDDLAVISRTATRLEEFHITALSTISIKGVMDIIKASQSTLQVIEHSPRSDDGFFHPDPGTLAPGDHACDILIKCPKLRDLSISVPSMCAHLFSDEDVRWEGECQVRAMTLCDCNTKGLSASNARDQKISSLRRLLDQARELISNRSRQRKELDVELFFADCIFDPRDCVVHGDFTMAEISSNGQWPVTKTASGKGPYGSSGLYGKDEGAVWEIVTEEEWLRAVENRWITI